MWTAARGSNVSDVDGNVYVDLTAGFGAALLGHGYSGVVRAVRAQSERLMHALGDVYPSDAKIALESRLAALAPWKGSRVILGLSGADAVEAALKSCALATRRAGVLALRGGYHGLSYGALRACAYSEAFRRPFVAQLGPAMRVAAFPEEGDAAACARALEETERALSDGFVGAVLIEPVRARGGVCVADPETCGRIVRAAHRAGALVVADEIYCGMYRAGRGPSYAGARWPGDSLPDAVLWGKALGGTLPVSACVLREEVAVAWGAPDQETIHTSTFLGNPLAAAASMAALDAMGEASFDERVRERARALRARVLDPLVGAGEGELCWISAVRGDGLLLGVELRTRDGVKVPALALVRALLARGYLVLPGGAAAEQLSITPAVTLTDAQIEGFGAALRDALKNFAA